MGKTSRSIADRVARAIPAVGSPSATRRNFPCGAGTAKRAGQRLEPRLTLGLPGDHELGRRHLVENFLHCVNPARVGLSPRQPLPDVGTHRLQLRVAFRKAAACGGDVLIAESGNRALGNTARTIRIN